MNLDDLLCVGIYNHLLYSSSIDRNKHLIPGEVLQALIEGSQEFFDNMKTHGINIAFMGGETADVGDVVRTIAVNGTIAARWPKKRLITNTGIKSGDVIVGLASFGKSTYEKIYNSGIGSNGLTSARHDVISRYYADEYPESFDNFLQEDVVYIGQHRLTDEIKVAYHDDVFTSSIGKLILSPTRTFAPVVKRLLEEEFESIHGMIHCSGGGQTKCMKYVPDNVRVVKDNLFDPPEIFRIIQESSGSDDREMYQVFNMGCRLELYTDENKSNQLIRICNEFGIDAQVIGRVEAANKNELNVVLPSQYLVYN
jgi:phosphoribosylformylglycinamidine cyclo-ligase